MLRTVSSVSGECSSSSHRKWNPALAARAATSRLVVVIVHPKTGCDSRNRRRTGFSHTRSITSSSFFYQPDFGDLIAAAGAAHARGWAERQRQLAAARRLHRHVELHRLDGRWLLDGWMNFVLVVGNQPDERGRAEHVTRVDDWNPVPRGGVERRVAHLQRRVPERLGGRHPRQAPVGPGAEPRPR